MLKIRTKASQITNLTDARYFAAWDVAWLGFCFDTASFAYINPTLMQAIKGWVEGPKIVGEFSNRQTAEQILAAKEMLDFDIIQLAAGTPQVTIEDLKEHELILEIAVVKNQMDMALQTIQNNKNSANVFLLNFVLNKFKLSDLVSNPGNLDALKKCAQEANCIISIDANATELEQLIEMVQPYGIDVKGGEEEKVGFKSFDELDEIFEALEEQV